MNLDICEKFFSISGEAPRSGFPCYVVRFSGCNLSCAYCDTSYHAEIREQLSEENLFAEISAKAAMYPSAFIMFTGGEPLLFGRDRVISSIAEKLSETTFYVETNGSLKIENFSLKNLRYVVDWKTPSSGEQKSFCRENLEHLRPGIDCVKIVVSSEDLPFAEDALREIKLANRGLEVFFSPQWGAIGFDELAAFIVERRLDAALSLQLHKIIWGDKRGV